MKQLNKIFAVKLVSLAMNSYAQDENNKWAVSFGINAVDTRVGAQEPFADRLGEFFNVKDTWNYISAHTYVSVDKYIGNSFAFAVTGSLNRIIKYLEHVSTVSPVTHHGDLEYYGLDAAVSFSFQNLIG